jgi:2-oxoglutarate dehydrogenase E2 component (dihydrolipoamide succinyltransferase)
MPFTATKKETNMSFDILVPSLPESVSDATLVAWHKQPGDIVGAGENLADLETDKVVLEVPAPSSGVLKEIIRAAGETVVGGELLAIMDVQAQVSSQHRISKKPPF